MKNNNLITTILLVIIVGALAFFGGMKYQESKSSFTRGGNQFFQQRGQRGINGQQGGQMRFRNGFGGGTIGKILSIDADTVTVQLPDGSSKIVNISNATMFAKTATASKEELKTGENILAVGEANSDGSITATRIQLNPPMMNRPSISPTQ